jgi:hypothetical protein
LTVTALVLQVIAELMHMHTLILVPPPLLLPDMLEQQVASATASCSVPASLHALCCIAARLTL